MTKKEHEISPNLEKARAYERKKEMKVEKERPAFHLTPRVGWLNDPNGFSYYNGRYHLFYQYNPYRPFWGPMHWGHAVSKDLLHWSYLPAALAPDQPYDNGNGCFSGSAQTFVDGRQMLMYTGVSWKKQPDGSMKEIQQQCIALGDGSSYEKYEHNPVISSDQLPIGYDKSNFRDPKIWKESDGSWRCVAVSRNASNGGAVLLFESPNGFSWKLKNILAQNSGRFGRMWECPDFFELDNQNVLIVSTMEMEAEGLEYPNGNGVVCQIGGYDDTTGHFEGQKNQSLDYGIDFYAPQTMLAPDGRRILIGWMQNLASVNQHSEDEPYFGQLTIPRELTIRNNRLIQCPVRELDACRENLVSYRDLVVSGEKRLNGIEGRVADMELSIQPGSDSTDDFANGYQLFEMRFAQNGNHYVALRYRPHESELEIDRSYSGLRNAFVHKRSCKVRNQGGVLKLRVVLDRFSAEVFANDGEQVMSITFQTDAAANEISFVVDGLVRLNVTKYGIK